MYQQNETTLTCDPIVKEMDHSLLKPAMTEEEVIAGCELAKQHRAASVCVKPCDVNLAASILKGTEVQVGTVIGFPYGSSVTKIKMAEARQAMLDGAVELDVVLNIGALRSGKYNFVYEDIKAVVDTARGKARVKVILENDYLTDEQKAVASQLSEKAGAVLA